MEKICETAMEKNVHIMMVGTEKGCEASNLSLPFIKFKDFFLNLEHKFFFAKKMN